MMWYLVKDLLLHNPSLSDEELRKHTYSKFSYETPDWLISEARFVHGQKVRRGEYPSTEGFASIETLQQTFMRLSAPDRAKFLDWAQFTLMSTQSG
jgi:hypothetical protein